MKPFILASSSPRRLELLEQVNLKPNECIAPDVDESVLKNELPRDYCRRIAHAKAQAVLLIKSDSTILAADTTVHLGRKILGKAESELDAREFLNKISGRRHRVLTCIVLYAGNIKKERLVETVVQFKRLTGDEIDDYISSNEWQGKAGGYAIQGSAGGFVKFINGSYTNVVGLPLYETLSLLKAV